MNPLPPAVWAPSALWAPSTLSAGTHYHLGTPRPRPSAHTPPTGYTPPFPATPPVPRARGEGRLQTLPPIPHLPHPAGAHLLLFLPRRQQRARTGWRWTLRAAGPALSRTPPTRRDPRCCSACRPMARSGVPSWALTMAVRKRGRGRRWQLSVLAPRASWRPLGAARTRRRRTC